MTDEKKSQDGRPNIRWVKSPNGVFETYANQTHINWSLDDVRLRFAQIGESDEGAQGPGAAFVPVNVEKAAITLSWRNAKVLYLQLSQIIGNHEKVNGEINVKPTLASNEGT